MTTLKIIKNEQELMQAKAALIELQEIPGKSQEQLDQMELLSHLVEQYEATDNRKIVMPDPIEAIEFRLEQLGLKRKDLKTYIGSPSKISEVMNRRIPLSLQMIRALHEGLDIPAEVLLRDSNKAFSDSPYLPKDFPFAEMLRRGYLEFSGTLAQAKEIGEELLTQFFAPMPKLALTTRFRKSNVQATDDNAVKAWQCHVIHKALEEKLPAYHEEKITSSFFNDIASLSQYQFGPQTAGEKLRNAGIHLIYAPHLPKTHIDGASFILSDGHPVIAMTLRYDRLDNYWFTLLHELHHVMKDLPNRRNETFMDDTENQHEYPENEVERAADMAAENALIPATFWNSKKSQSLLQTTSSAIVRNAAVESGISPAILAGRIRWETKRYYLFQDLIGKCRNQLMPNETKELSDE